MSTPEVPPEGGRDAFTRERMQKIAQLVNEELPREWGFFVMAFPFNDSVGRMNYVSNGKRETILLLMQEFIDKGALMEGHHADKITDADRFVYFFSIMALAKGEGEQITPKLLTSIISDFVIVTGWQKERVLRAVQHSTDRLIKLAKE